MSDAVVRGGVAAIAYRALNRANDAHAEIESHEKLCAQRYASIESSIGTIIKILAWGGSTLFGLLILVIGFLAVRLIDADDDETERLRNKVHFLEQRAPVGAGESH